MKGEGQNSLRGGPLSLWQEAEGNGALFPLSHPLPCFWGPLSLPPFPTYHLHTQITLVSSPNSRSSGLWFLLSMPSLSPSISGPPGWMALL